MSMTTIGRQQWRVAFVTVGGICGLTVLAVYRADNVTAFALWYITAVIAAVVADKIG